jgi:hypothetical protein
MVKSDPGLSQAGGSIGAAAVPPEDESSSSGAASSSSCPQSVDPTREVARRIALMENDEDEDEVAMMEAHTASMMDAIADGVEVELQFREDYEPGKTTYQIFVQTLKGETITLDISILDDVDSVKAMVEAKTGIPADKQRLTCGGHRLEDVGANIKKEITLHLMLSLLGGMGKRGRGGGDSATNGLAEMRNEFGRSMKMIEDNRSSAAANMTFNAMTTLNILMARYKTTSAHEVLNTLNDEQIEAIQGVMASTTILTRYKGIAKSIFGHIYDAMDQANAQLKDCEKILLEGTVLVLNTQYGTPNNLMSWEVFAKDLTKAIAMRAARAGAIAGAAAATAAAAAVAGDADIAFEAPEGGRLT